MPKFFYKAKKGPKQIVNGVVEAETQAQALLKLESSGLYPMEIKEQHQKEKERKTPLSRFEHRVGYRDLAVFTRQISDLLGSGLTILSALEVLSQQVENRELKIITSSMADFVKDGGNFSEALNKHPKVFSNLYVSMVKAGEVGGILAPVLDRLADFTEAEDDLRTKVRSALAYPSLMGFVGLGTVLVLLIFVIPRLVSMFEDMGQVLPLPTALLVSISNFLINFWWLIAAVAAIVGFIIKRRISTKEGRLILHRVKMSLFLIGPIVKKAEIARFTRTLGALLANGVPILKALDVAAKTIENEVLKQDLERIAKEVADGADFSASLKINPIFPTFVTNMVHIGEKGGQLEKVLLKVADTYERDVGRAVKTLTSLLEPIMILMLGAIVGFIVISMLLPIFQINLLAR